MVLRIPHALHRSDPRRCDRSRIGSGEIRELREDVVRFGRRAIALPSQAKVQRQAPANLPVIIDEQVEVFHDVVAIGVTRRACGGIDGKLRIVGKIILEIAVRVVADVADGAIRVQSAHIRRLGAECVGEVILPGGAQVPVAVQDAVLPAAAEFERMLAFRPG